MVLDFLGECVCESREGANTHPYRQILPLDKTGTYVLWIGIPAYDLHIASDALGWRIARFVLDRCAINLL